MLTLRTLGRLELATPDGAAVGGRRMLLALLAWLCRRRSGTAQREQIAALLWEDQDEKSARHSLRQLLTELRALLPHGALDIGPDQVSLDLTRVTADLIDFEQRIRRQDWRGAVQLCQGEFLPGADSIGGEEWRTWLDTERSVLHRQLAGAFEVAIQGETREGNWTEATELAERWVLMQPHEEAAAATQIRTLLQAGQQTAAAAAFAASSRRLQTDEASPSPQFTRLGELVAPPGGTAVSSRRVLTPDLAGRRRQSAALFAAWERVETGSGLLVVIEGDEGSGKTRLVEELLRSLRNRAQRVQVVAAQAYAAEAGTSCRVLASLLDGLASAPGLPGADRSDLAALAAVSPALHQRFPGPPDSSRPSATESLPRVLEVIASESPIAVVLDDAHHADGDSLESLATLARRLPPRVLLILTSLPGKLGTGAFRELLSHSSPTTLRISVGPLDLSATLDMVSSMAPVAAAAAVAIATAAVEDLGGLPGDTRDLVERLTDSGQLRPDGLGVLDLASPLTRPVGLPESLREETARRLKALPVNTRGLLELAAAKGPIELRQLEAASNEPPETFQEQLGDLLARRLLRRSMGPGERFEFASEATRRAVWESLSPRRRRELHQQVAGGPRATGKLSTIRRATIAAVTVVLGGAAWVLIPRPVAEAGSTILLADVQNDTGNPNLDRALTLVAAIELNEGHRVTLFPRSRVREAIVRMGRPGADSILDEALAREVAERENVPLVLVFDATRAGDQYLLAARLLRPATGEVLRASSETVTGEAEVLAGMGRLLRAVRRSLGEASADLPAAGTLPAVSTSSLEALREYAAGQVAWTRRDYGVAKGFWQRAVDRDTTFALAWAALASEAYRTNNTGEGERLLQKALAGAAGLTRREQMALEVTRASRLGTTAEALGAARTLANRYPDRDSWYGLGTALLRASQCEEAIPALQRSLAFDSTFTNGHINLATCHQFLLQFDSALVSYERAGRTDSTVLRFSNVGEEYGTALMMAGDRARAAAAFGRMTEWGPDWNRGRGHRQLAWMAMAEGRHAEALRQVQRALGYTSSAGGAPLSQYRDRMLLASALLGAGDSLAARREWQAAWRERPDSLIGVEFLERAAYLGWRLGVTAEMPAILSRAVTRTRRGVGSSEAAGVAVHAFAELARRQPVAALRHVEAVWPGRSEGRWGFLAVARAEALAGSGATDSALALWQRISRSPWLGNELQDPWIRADLEIARLAERTGNTVLAREAVERFLERWSGADSGSPELREAIQLRERLGNEGAPPPPT